MPAPSTTTIGVFDSGFGGLTVLRALLPLIPGAHYIYLGDTARLPYGAKSQTTIARYAVESARFLATQGADLLVIACNTATALALDDIRRSVPIPVIGVIEPGANAALAVISSYKPRHPERSISRSLRDTESKDPDEAGITSAPNTFQPQASEILVLATAATVQSHAYRHACETLGLHATEVACPLLVPLVEEGWTNHPVTPRSPPHLPHRSPPAMHAASHPARLHSLPTHRPGHRANPARPGLPSHRHQLRPSHSSSRSRSHKRKSCHPERSEGPAFCGCCTRHLHLLRHRLHRKIPAPRQSLPRPTHPPRRTPRPRRLTRSFYPLRSILYTLLHALPPKNRTQRLLLRRPTPRR